MTQFCRYCSHMICGDVNYCEIKETTYTDKQIKRTNQCRQFEFCSLDALYGVYTYQPRPKKKINLYANKNF